MRRLLSSRAAAGRLLLPALLLGLPGASNASGLTATPVLAGTWAQEFVTTSVSDVPIVGEVRAATRTLLHMQIEQEDGAATIRARVCAIDVGGGGGVVRTIIPDAFVASLPEREIRVRLRTDGDGTRIDDWEQVEVLGADLANPATDPLPSGPDDPTVVDSDRDGAPGVSVRVRGLVNGEIHLVQRGWSRLEATTVTDQRIDGHIEWTNEQVILDATARVLRESPPTWPDPSRRRNYFRTVRLDPATSCDDVIRTERSLFDD